MDFFKNQRVTATFRHLTDPAQFTSIAGNERLPADNLLFAGEHARYRRQGTMEGAVRTGMDAAAAILNPKS